MEINKAVADVPDPDVDADEDEDEDQSAVDEMRDSGVGTSDPTIVGDTEPREVDAEFSDDEPEV